MATLAFSLAGQFVGGLVGGPIGATLGRALGALAGSAIDSSLFGSDQGSQVRGDIRLQGSSQGGGIPRIYGWNRMSGNIIWATELERIEGQSSGAKGLGSSSDDEQIAANFAIALCEGEVNHFGRIWADGELLDIEGLNIRFYSGSQTQLADSLISAKQGADTAPAYRGTCYVVFERLPLEQFGNRIPNISVELCRPVGDLEQSIHAINVIPASTEFGYDPVPRVRIVGPGAVESENAHVLGQSSDWTLSIDELQGLCPNLKNVTLVVAWFGDDLRCGSCNIEPRVEGYGRTIKGTQWIVSGMERDEVPLISEYDGGPAYGGSPSDASVLAAIADLKARGLKVTLHPFILMDVQQGNALTDPYTQAAGQPLYPWRGRITCDPAPGVAMTPDNSAAIDPLINAFIGGAALGHFTPGDDTVAYSGPADGSYRRMVLHYAHLAELAGGVDAILLGSELRGLTMLRRSVDEFPFVEALVDLADDVRTIVGSGTKITYAADWSEYSGLQPADAPGDKIFHLDPLWSSANIDAISIDNYMPISDWRDGTGHADAALATSPYDLAYLSANIAGGEGYDWYYASSQDREAGTRSDISDGAYDEPWVFRYKDLVSWWSNAHHNRIDGVRQVSATAWVPESKPIWQTELGCGAVDKGANLPSAFGDPKSSEDALPYFSSGAPDASMQRQFLRAHHHWWQPNADEFAETNNPQSGLYSGRMIDPERMYLWTWDARPYPAFPNLLDVWKDGGNYTNGHWLTGRLGALGAAELITAIAADCEVTIHANTSGGLLIQGMQVDGESTIRDAIGPLLEGADLWILDRPEGLFVHHIGGAVADSVTKDIRVDTGNAIVTRKRADSSAAIGRLGFSFLERQRDYLTGTITAIALEGAGGASLNSGLVIEEASARAAAENALGRLSVIDDTLEFNLPPSSAELEVGDLVDVEDQSNGPFVITEIRDGTFRRISARVISSQTVFAILGGGRTQTASATLTIGAPVIAVAHLPPLSDRAGPSRLAIGASAQPWPGEVVIESVTSRAELISLSASATIGELIAPLDAAGAELWDRKSSLKVTLYYGHLSAKPEAAVLAGSNRMAIERDDDSWEIIGFAKAELVSAATYMLTNLVRGLEGTSDSTSPISSGNRFMLLDADVAILDVDPELLGASFDLQAFAGRKDSAGTDYSVQLGLDPLLPLAPAHAKAQLDEATSDVTLGWVRRTRVNGNSWALAEVPLEPTPEIYRVQILNGVVLVRTLESTSTSLTYSAAEQTMDFGSPPASFNFIVTQISPTLGAGHPATGVFNG